MDYSKILALNTQRFSKVLLKLPRERIRTEAGGGRIRAEAKNEREILAPARQRTGLPYSGFCLPLRNKTHAPKEAKIIMYKAPIPIKK